MNCPKEELATTSIEDLKKQRAKMIQAINDMLESTTMDHIPIDKLAWFYVTTNSTSMGMTAYESMTKRIGHDNTMHKIKALRDTLKIMS